MDIPAKAAKPKSHSVITATVPKLSRGPQIVSRPLLSVIPRPSKIPSAHKASKLAINGNSRVVNGHAPQAARSSTKPKISSKEVGDRLVRLKRPQAKSASPAPQPLTSDDEGDEQTPNVKKRKFDTINDKRKVRDDASFTGADGLVPCVNIVHSADVANTDIVEQGRSQYRDLFTHLNQDEDDDPVVTFQYPSATRSERYRLVVPNDKGDYDPLSEIGQNMKCVAEHYLEEADAKKIHDPEFGSCLWKDLDRAAKGSHDANGGAQSRFIGVIEKYNSMINNLRKEGKIAKKLDQMYSVPRSLVDHIKDQVYARIVSPQIELVRKYKAGTDNVYGELLPGFLTEIFRATNLKSDQVFVDLGSGVGNCVLQAALEVGCESWGCEFTPHYDQLAQAQLIEFKARCRLWGLKPGEAKLLYGDFFKTVDIDAALKRADVVLINNEVFSSETNGLLKLKFLDFKEGCQIVSLKPFVDADQDKKKMNEHDTGKVLDVIAKDRFSGRVSWTDASGKWYIHTKKS